MSDVRRATVSPIWNDEHGKHAVIPWEEYKRLRKVVDAARKEAKFHVSELKRMALLARACHCDLCEAVAALCELEDS